jgi:hypothetical protein
MLPFAIGLGVLAVFFLVLARWAFLIHRGRPGRGVPIAVAVAFVGTLGLLVYMGVLLPSASGSGSGEAAFLFIVVGGVVAVVQAALALMLYVWRG